jgi:hypothetical protein
MNKNKKGAFQPLEFKQALQPLNLQQPFLQQSHPPWYKPSDEKELEFHLSL